MTVYKSRWKRIDRMIKKTGNIFISKEKMTNFIVIWTEEIHDLIFVILRLIRSNHGNTSKSFEFPKKIASSLKLFCIVFIADSNCL
jgi:hypothetical protein